MKKYVKMFQTEHSNASQNILITGSSGFVGAKLACKLKEDGAKVVCFDKKNGNDVTKPEDVNNVGKVELVFHLAAVSSVAFSLENPRETYTVNVLGMLNILEFCRNTGAKLVFPSSYVYGAQERLPVDELASPAPNNPYVESKLICEELCKAYNRDFGVRTVIIRFFNIYGPGQDVRFLIPKIIEGSKRGKVELFDPQPKRDYVFVDDAVEAYLKAAQYKEKSYEIFNIGSGKSYSVQEVVEMISKLTGKKIDVTYSNKRRKNEIMDCKADYSKAEKLLGWTPRVTIEEGLKQCINY